MKLDGVKLSHTDIWPLGETVWNNVFKNKFCHTCRISKSKISMNS